MTETTLPDLPVCPATMTTGDGRRYRCWLEPGHTDPHLAIDREQRTRVRWIGP